MKSTDQKDEAPELAGDGGFKGQKTADSANSAGAGQAHQAVCKPTQTLRLVGGPMRVDVTETPGTVFIAFSGVKPRGFEARKVRNFLAPIVEAYSHDCRRLEISGMNSHQTGHVEHLAPRVVRFSAVDNPKGVH